MFSHTLLGPDLTGGVAGCAGVYAHAVVRQNLTLPLCESQKIIICFYFSSHWIINGKNRL